MSPLDPEVSRFVARWMHNTDPEPTVRAAAVRAAENASSLDDLPLWLRPSNGGQR